MPERTTTSRRRRRLVRGASATLVLLGVGVYALVHYESGSRSEPHCAVRGADPESEPHRLSPAQAANAAVIAAVGTSRGLPERAVTIAIATAMQESSLRNLDYGDRDSLGLFQQRPSMGWGSEEQVTDPVYAAGAFYDKLVEIPAYEELPLTEAAQEVQRSAFPDEYAKHEANATLLSGALTGRVPGALSCVTGNDPRAGDPAELERELAADFAGRATVEGSGADSGMLTVTLAEAGGEATSDPGWELAHWLVARAGQLGVSEVSWDGVRWESERSDDGWREDSAGTEDADDATDDSGESGNSGGNSRGAVRLSLVTSTE
ncbi:heavy metal transporter [Streptomyces sp. 3MP-14]|uniref:Heavy metal transporter n=1 Tax=Streptomyces mimosae TaxID=2586635 RepID=A0A5N6A8I6_9ACTN|nr:MULTISPECIES: heavy metal transporter [Streptomyces]KAB8165127.1 heavy metal transporter [Streptomyces mimosae]KAB8175759.1 heavy metal transporter [Streptomyces sp. 3MP-14]